MTIVHRPPRSFGAAALIGTALLLTSPISDAVAAALRPQVIVHGDTVRLGDLFDGAGAKSDTAVMRAPAPGKTVTLPIRWLKKVARAYRLDWQPGGRLREAVVKRSSKVLDRAQLLAALHSELEATRKIDGAFEVSLDDPTLQIHLPVQMPATVAVRGLHYDARNRRYTATLHAPDDRADAAHVPVSGRVHRMVAVPVLSRRLRAGDVIRANDIRHRQMRANTVANNTLVEHSQIVGKSVRRTMRTDRPIRTGDVREPLLVQRGSLVTMTYNTANMAITAQGKARENGTKGETVRVLNTNSGKTVEAIVTGLATVSVRPLGAARTR